MITLKASIPHELFDIETDRKAVIQIGSAIYIWVLRSPNERDLFLSSTVGMNAYERQRAHEKLMEGPEQRQEGRLHSLMNSLRILFWAFAAGSLSTVLHAIAVLIVETVTGGNIMSSPLNVFLWATLAIGAWWTGYQFVERVVGPKVNQLEDDDLFGLGIPAELLVLISWGLLGVAFGQGLADLLA